MSSERNFLWTHMLNESQSIVNVTESHEEKFLDFISIRTKHKDCPCKLSAFVAYANLPLCISSPALLRCVIWRKNLRKLSDVCKSSVSRSQAIIIWSCLVHYSSWGSWLRLVDKCHMKGIVRQRCILTFISAPTTDQLVKLNSKLLIALLCVPVPSPEENSSLEREEKSGRGVGEGVGGGWLWHDWEGL